MGASVKMLSISNAKLRIAVVVPCYRVAQHIESVVETMPALVDEIYLVDDASPDNLEQVVLRMIDPRVRFLRHSTNQGVGGAMLTGYRAAFEGGADIIVKMDGDGQMDPRHLPALLLPLLEGRADYTKGNRWIDEQSLQQMPPVRRWGNVGLSFAAKIASGCWNIFDPCNGYTAIRASIVPLLSPANIARDYFFETSMLVELNIARAVVLDVPLPALYGDEVSSLRIGRVLVSFPTKLASSLRRRIWQRYFVRDFGAATLFLLSGGALAAWGVGFGAFAWLRSAITMTPSTTGTVILSEMPLLMGFQLLLQALVMDIGSENKPPISSRSSDEQDEKRSSVARMAA